MNKSFAVAAVLGLVGCAAPANRGWYKPGGTDEGEYPQDRYACMQESRQQSSAGYANAYGAATQSGMTVNDQMWSACMGARGWRYGEGGNTCVGRNAYVGQTIRNAGMGRAGTLTRIYGPSDRCTSNPSWPIWVTVDYK
jgi:hypothetical protein